MINKKFNKFRESVTPQQFNDIHFLTQKAEELRKNDPMFAQRILVRVENLKKREEKFNQCKQQWSEQQWNDIGFLQQQINQTDPNDAHFITKLQERINVLEALKLPEEVLKMDEAVNGSATQVSIWNRVKSNLRYPFVVLVVIPTILFSIYQVFIASERFESQAKVMVQQPDASTTLDASMAILSGLGVGTSSGSDPEILKTYIYSMDMLNYLEEIIHLKEHYNSEKIDIFSRLFDEDKESFLKYYQDHIDVEIDSKSGILSIYAQGFNPEFASKLVQTIVKRSEWYINSIGHQLAKAQLDFVKKEHANIEHRLKVAQGDLLKYQQKYNLLDPTADGAAIQQIAYTLEGQITAKEAELKTARHIMSETAPRVISLKQEIAGLRMQLKNERAKLVTKDETGNMSVGDILAKFADLKVDNELALQAYTASQVSLEKSRIETYRQLKYLIVVENPTISDKNKYPDVPYNITLFFMVFAMGYGVGRIIYLTIQELK